MGVVIQKTATMVLVHKQELAIYILAKREVTNNWKAIATKMIQLNRERDHTDKMPDGLSAQLEEAVNGNKASIKKIRSRFRTLAKHSK